MRNSWPTAVAHRIGLGGAVQFTNTRVGVTLHLPCRGWGEHQPHTVDVKIAPGQNPEAIAKKLLNDGWRIGHRLTCPDARKKKGKEPTVPNDTRDRAMSSASGVAIAASTGTPTAAAGRARRLVYMALEDYYDEGKKAYKPGHTDASIAQECGVAEQLVKTIREESYGPLAVPGEAAALHQLLLACTQTFTETVERAKREVAEAATLYGTQLKDVQADFDRLARKNNWAR